MKKKFNLSVTTEKRISHIRPMLLLSFVVFCVTGFAGCEGTTTDPDGGDGNVIGTDNSIIATPTIWEAGSTHIIDCALNVNSTLTIQEGCTVKFTENGSMTIGSQVSAALIADGSKKKPVLFTGSKSEQAGSWNGITFGQNNVSATTKLNNCILEGAGKNNKACLSLANTRMAMDSCIVRKSASYGIELSENAGFSLFENNQLESCADYLIKSAPQSLLGLSANNTFTPTGNKAIALVSGMIKTSGTLTKLPVPYTVLGTFEVDGGELTIEKGTTIRFDIATALCIGRNQFSALIAEGTASEPITFTSASASPQTGDWTGIQFFESNSSNKSSIKYAVIDYAGRPDGSLEGAILNYSGLKLENTTIRNSTTNAVNCANNGYFVTCINNTFSNCDKDPVIIFANHAHTIGSGNSITAGAGLGIRVTGETVSQNVRWLKQTVPYIIDGCVYIQTNSGNAVLNINPGCTLHFMSGSNIEVQDNGTLLAQGTADNRITFTSNAITPSPGDWDGIGIGYGTSRTILDYCNIEYAGHYSEYNIGIGGYNVTVSNCAINHSLVNGIKVFYNEPAYNPTLLNNTFTSNLGSDVIYEQ